MTDEPTKELDNTIKNLKDRIQQYEDGLITGFELHTIMVDHLTNLDLKPLKEQHDKIMEQDENQG
jgi:hypothetical protein